MRKKLISLGLAAAMLISVTGCGVVGSVNYDDISSIVESRQEAKQTEKERVIAEAQAYLKENYPDDEFTYVSGRSPDWAYHYYELAFTSKKYNNQEVIVYGDPKKEENSNSAVTSYYRDIEGKVIYNYFDTYYEYSMKEEAEQFFHDIVTKYISGDILVDVNIYDGIGFACKVNNKVGFIDNATCNNLTFSITFTIDYTPTEIRDSIQDMLEEFVRKKIYIANIFFVQYALESDDYPICSHYTTRDGIIKEK